MTSKRLKYIIFHKPFGVLSQFSKDLPDLITLADFIHEGKDIYPVGRLDKDSEGLLILTNDRSLNNALLNPSFAHKRAYWVQVEGEISDDSLKQLCRGVDIRINKKTFRTRPAEAIRIDQPDVEKREPPIRFRKSIPTSWLLLTLTEGKNRQVRRMCAKVGFPVLRLIRCQIGDMSLEGLKRGKIRMVELDEIRNRVLNID